LCVGRIGLTADNGRREGHVNYLQSVVKQRRIADDNDIGGKGCFGKRAAELRANTGGLTCRYN